VELLFVQEVHEVEDLGDRVIKRRARQQELRSDIERAKGFEQVAIGAALQSLRFVDNERIVALDLAEESDVTSQTFVGNKLFGMISLFAGLP
jgi:hypothetical protein